MANNFVHGTSDFTYSWWTKWNNTPTTYQTYIDNGTWGNTLLFRQENATQIGIYSMGPLR